MQLLFPFNNLKPLTVHQRTEQIPILIRRLSFIYTCFDPKGLKVINLKNNLAISLLSSDKDLMPE